MNMNYAEGWMEGWEVSRCERIMYLGSGNKCSVWVECVSVNSENSTVHRQVGGGRVTDTCFPVTGEAAAHTRRC